MRAGVGEYLDYNIYTIENGRIWGNGATGSTVSISGGLLAIGHWQVSRDMHAVVTPLPTTKPGHYTDTVVVRIV
jgi:spore coat protein U-like protein